MGADKKNPTRLSDIIPGYIPPGGGVYPRETAMPVSEIAGSLYSTVGASDDEILYGCEFFLRNSHDPRIKCQALSKIIQIKTKRLINKQL